MARQDMIVSATRLASLGPATQAIMGKDQFNRGDGGFLGFLTYLELFLMGQAEIFLRILRFGEFEGEWPPLAGEGIQVEIREELAVPRRL